jgi:phosphoribosylamine--glycine ligase
MELIMNILVLGSGGREHSLIWAISQNPKCKEIFCAPGNAGIKKLAKIASFNILNQNEVISFCEKKNIDFVIIGPEAPLVAGLSDALKSEGILTFGPSKAASMLEASKSFTKEVCKLGNIPTATSETFYNDENEATYIMGCEVPIVLKADGLAAGKGVIIAETREAALKSLKDIFNGKFGTAGNCVVIEEFLQGEEASYFVLTDGKTLLPIGSAQDHKRAYDGDNGPNTGGMGAYSPAPIISQSMEEKILSKIIQPTVEVMKSKKQPFVGVLYAGLMIKDNEPKLIEYNVRFGDPECQALMVRLGAQILDVLLHCAEETLYKCSVNWAMDAAISIVVATKGYPGHYKTGTIIRNLEAAEDIDGVNIFHSGTSYRNGEIVANGGRVLNVTCRAENLESARDKAYRALSLIDFKDSFYRKDIGWRALKN